MFILRLLIEKQYLIVMGILIFTEESSTVSISGIDATHIYFREIVAPVFHLPILYKLHLFSFVFIL